MKNLTLPLLLLLAACGGSPSTDTAPEVPISEEIESVLSASMPDAPAVPIPEARTSVSGGDPVVLEGRIMGVMKPFVENRAVFILGDRSVITPCNEMEDDHCDTPWDACCDPGELKVQGTASIQIVDASGSVIKQGLEGVGGLEKLSRVKVAGTVDPASSEQSLIVNAQAIQVLP